MGFYLLFYLADGVGLHAGLAGTALIPWSLHITGINIIQAGLLYCFGKIYGDAGGFQVALLILLAAASSSCPSG